MNSEFEKSEKDYLEWLEEVREKNDSNFEIIQKIMPYYSDYAKKSLHKKTLLALTGFYVHLATLKNSLIDLSEDENIYCMKAVYRVYLEHWLKGMYIWIRYTKEKNDSVGEEYNSMGRIGEALKYGNSVKHVSVLIDAENKGLDVWDAMCEHDAILKKLSKKDITKNIKKFEYKNIAKYILDSRAPGSDWIPTIIMEYSELSSYIHGGPNATYEYGTSLYDKQFEEYKGMIRFSFNTSYMFAYSIFILMFKDNKNDKIKELLSELQKFQDKERIL